MLKKNYNKASRPVDVHRTAELVAEIKGESYQMVAEKTTGNARKFFGIQENDDFLGETSHS